MYGKMRIFMTCAALSIGMLVFGLGELLRCGKTLLGPSTVTFAQATGQGGGGLASYGYVRVTGARSAMDRTVIVMKMKKNQSVDQGQWAGAYVPIVDAADDQESGPCSLLAWLPQANEDADLDEMESLEGEAGDELVGFVECAYEKLDPKHQQVIAPMARINTRNCWVVDVRKPSWLKGLGLVIGGLAIPGIAVAWKLKKGFVS